MTVMNQNTVINERRMFTVKDPISALTHLIGAIGAILGMPALLLQGARMGNSMAALGSYAVFMLSMIILYSASTSSSVISLILQRGVSAISQGREASRCQTLI